MGGDERIVVKLRFSPDVAYRVRESDWPCVDTIDDLPERRLSHDINRESHAGNETMDQRLGRRLRGDRTRGFATGHRKGYDCGGEDV